MGAILLTFGGVALLAGAATPLFAAFARRIGLVVQPRADRWHAHATPLLGGAGMAVAILVASVALLPASPSTIVVVACAAAAFALGLVDDFRRLAPATKLVGQAVIASMLAAGGVRVEIVPFAPLAYVITVLWVVGIMNAINLMDNMDGLAAGIAAIAAAVLAASAWGTAPVTAQLAVITAAAAIGFLVHNFNPARVFMGDAGSQLLGFMLAAAAVAQAGPGATSLGVAVLAPLAALALPIFDTTLVTAARRLSGTPVSKGGRDHTSHRLAALGLSDRAVVLVLYAVAGGFGLLAVGAETVSGLTLPLFVLGVICLVLFGVFLVEIGGRGAKSREVANGRRFQRVLATYGRFGAEIALDVVLLTTVYYLSHVIRFEGQAQELWLYLFAGTVPIVVGAQLGAMVLLGVYRTLWRYLSIQDAALIIRALSIGSAAAVVILVLGAPVVGYSRSAFVLDWILACASIVGVRSFMVWLIAVFSAPTRARPEARRVLIAGANETGVLALRILGSASGTGYQVVGFIDDDPGKRYRRVAGVPVVGTTRELSTVIERLRPDLVLSAGEDAVPLRMVCEEHGVPWREFSVEV
jgi:UDP-GlcNAc:undecaprenyl-phosphate GlcNAc-1-phosphate transferase